MNYWAYADHKKGSETVFGSVETSSTFIFAVIPPSWSGPDLYQTRYFTRTKRSWANFSALGQSVET
jgi:hypothetical protein